MQLHRVADLSDPSQQKVINTSEQELTGILANAAGAAPTQQLGAALFAVPGLQGFVFPSAKNGSLNLAVFMDKPAAGSSLSFRNELSKKTERLR
jgi:hypothetical protein